MEKEQGTKRTGGPRQAIFMNRVQEKIYMNIYKSIISFGEGGAIYLRNKGTTIGTHPPIFFCFCVQHSTTTL